MRPEVEIGEVQQRERDGHERYGESRERFLMIEPVACTTKQVPALPVPRPKGANTPPATKDRRAGAGCFPTEIGSVLLQGATVRLGRLRSAARALNPRPVPPVSGLGL
jgi:hypothetical protein